MGPFVVMHNVAEVVYWLSPTGDGVYNGPVRRPWLAERQRPFAATLEIVGLKVGDQCWSWWPLCLAGASAVADDSVLVQPRGLLVCFGQSAAITLSTDRQTWTTESIFPFFWDINDVCRRTKRSTRSRRAPI